MEEVSASAEGELGRTPLAHVLVYALDKRLTGALFLSPHDAAEHVVRLVRGVPVKVRPGDRHSLLGEMLVAANAIDQATLEAALSTNGLLGDVLVLAGRVDRDVLESLAEQQFVRRMVRLFVLPPDTRYRYTDGSDELADYGGDAATVDPIELIWQGIRAHGEVSTKLGETLSRIATLPLPLHPQNTVFRFGATAPETEVIELLEAHPATLEELLGLDLAPPEIVCRLVYALVITRQLDLGTGATPLGTVDSGRPKSSSPPPRSSPIPGPPPAAAATAVARLQLRSTVHRVGAAAPDQPGDGERGGERRTTQPSAVVPVRLDSPVQEPNVVCPPEAPGSPETPKESTAPTAGGSPREAPGVATSSVAELYWAAAAALERRDFAAVIAACNVARAFEPDDPDFVALSIWAKGQLPNADVKALLVALDELLLTSPAHVEAHYFRALLRKRFSDVPGAVRDLRRVLELSPTHPDATRELAHLRQLEVPDQRPRFWHRLMKG
jgi:hypothetical protein